MAVPARVFEINRLSPSWKLDASVTIMIRILLLALPEFQVELQSAMTDIPRQ